MFEYDKKNEVYVKNGGIIKIVCKKMTEEKDIISRAIIEVFESKKPDLETLIYDEIRDYYDELSFEQMVDNLGVPTIDIDRELILYYNHTLDSEHIISVEYNGILDGFIGVTVEG